MKKSPKNSQIFVMPIFTTRGDGDPKVVAPLNPACQNSSVDTMESQIRHTVMEILTAQKILEEQQEEQQLHQGYNRFI